MLLTTVLEVIFNWSLRVCKASSQKEPDELSPFLMIFVIMKKIIISKCDGKCCLSNLPTRSATGAAVRHQSSMLQPH